MSLCRIQNGTVGEYDQPLAWPYPVRQLPLLQDDPSDPGSVLDSTQLLNNDTFLDFISIHFKDNRRLSDSFGMTVSSFSGKNMAVPHLPPQHDADIKYDPAIFGLGGPRDPLPSGDGPGGSVVPAPLADSKSFESIVYLWTEESLPMVDGSANHRRRMKTLQELGSDLADLFESFSMIDPKYGLDIIPCRIQIIKKTLLKTATEIEPRVLYDVIYDDDNFARSKVYAGAYSTITWQNVTPASGDVLMQQDPLTADTINHVPLKGKIYTFAGPVPKVWDKHRHDMHELFKPEFFEGGRYLLPNSKLHNLDEFKKPPRGRSIWSNCIGEQSISIGPGQFKKLRLNYRINDTLEDFFKRYRDADVDHLKMGRSVCICLEPAIRRQHIGEPIPYVALKEDATGKDVTVRYEPYQYKNMETDPTKLPRYQKVMRPLFTLEQDASTLKWGVRYWYKYEHSPFGEPYKDSALTLPGLLKGDLIIPPYDDGTGNIIQHPTGVPAPTLTIDGHDVVLASWTDGSGRVSKGDPLMFNVQINRLYTGAARLRKEAFLTVDMSGVKRKWNERLVPNTGGVPNQIGVDYYEDHELQSAVQAGVRTIIDEGTEGNLQVDADGAVHTTADNVGSTTVNVTGASGLTAAETTNAFVAALTQAGLVAGAQGLDVNVLAGTVGVTGSVPVTGTVGLTPGTTVPVANTNNVTVPVASGQVVGVVGTVGLTPGTTVPVSTTNLPTVQVSHSQLPTVQVSHSNLPTVDLTLGQTVPIDPTSTVPVSNPNNVTVGVTPGQTVNLAPNQTVAVANTNNVTVPVANTGNTTVPVANTNNVTVPVSSTNLPSVSVAHTNLPTVSVDHTNLPTVDVTPGQTVPIDPTSTVGLTPGTTVPLATGGTIDVNIVSSAITLDVNPSLTELAEYRQKFPDDIILTDVDFMQMGNVDTSKGTTSYGIIEFEHDNESWFLYDSAAGVPWTYSPTARLSHSGTGMFGIMFWKKAFDGSDYWIHPTFGGETHSGMVQRDFAPQSTQWRSDGSANNGVPRYIPFWHVFVGADYKLGGHPQPSQFRSFTPEFVAAATKQAFEFTTAYPNVSPSYVRSIDVWMRSHTFEHKYFIDYQQYPSTGLIAPGGPTVDWRYGPNWQYTVYKI